MDLGNKLKGALKKTTDVVKTAASEVDVKAMTDTVKGAAQSAVKKVGEVAKDGTDQVKAAMAKKAEEKKQLEEQKQIEAPEIIAISPINAVKAFYYLMSADGTIALEEEEKFDLIGAQIDADFAEHKEQIIGVCKAQLEKVVDPADYYDAVQDGVEEALMVEQKVDRGFVSPKLLVWNMLTIAYSDEEYNEDERKLIKYVVRKLNISKDVFLEMENSLLTVSDIEKEISWIKTTNRPYLTIEEHVKELEKRRNDIFESVKALIYL